MVLPINGSGKFLKSAISSLQNQEIPNPFEIIVVLDQVTSEVRLVLDQFQWSKLRLVKSERHGIAYAHNTGLEIAAYDFVAVVHSDDISLPNRFSTQSNLLQHNPEIVCVGGQLVLIDENGRPMGKSPYPIDPSHVRKAFRHKSAIPHPAAMYRREVALEVGGYRQQYAPAEDLDLWLRMLDIGDMTNVESEIVQYRVHAKQTSQVSLSRQSRAKVQVYWDRKHSNFSRNGYVTRAKILYLHFLAKGESSLVKCISYSKSGACLFALASLFIAATINPLNTWRTAVDFVKVRFSIKRTLKS